MSTKVFGAYPDELDSFSSLEYLVSPLQQAQTRPEPELETKLRMKSDFNNSLQKLTNLVYLLARDMTDDADKRTALTLMQSEVAHLAVLVRRAGFGLPEREKELEVTQ